MKRAPIVNNSNLRGTRYLHCEVATADHDRYVDEAERRGITKTALMRQVATAVARQQLFTIVLGEVEAS